MRTKKPNKTNPKKEKKLPLESEDFNSIAIYAGNFADLELLDLSFLNLKFEKLGSKEFDSFIATTKHHQSSNKSNFDEINEGMLRDTLYALRPIKVKKEINDDIFVHIQSAFLIMYPSDFRLYRRIVFQQIEGKLFWNYTIEWKFTFSGEDCGDNFMYFDKKQAVEVNEFLRLYFERKDKIKYLKLAEQAYINSYFQDHLHMAYVSLCICLESMTNGKTELIYRIKRNCSVLHGLTAENSWTIFKNIDLMYGERSKIVHGEDINWKKINEYFPRLRALVSRTLIELYTLNIGTIEELNNLLTQSSFGAKGELVKKRRHFELDIRSLVSLRLPLKK